MRQRYELTWSNEKSAQRTQKLLEVSEDLEDKLNNKPAVTEPQTRLASGQFAPALERAMAEALAAAVAFDAVRSDAREPGGPVGGTTHCGQVSCASNGG